MRSLARHGLITFAIVVDSVMYFLFLRIDDGV